LSGTKLDAQSAPTGGAPGMVRIKERKEKIKTKFGAKRRFSFPLRTSRLCGEISL
jgi:hypothetical protein